MRLRLPLLIFAALNGTSALAWLLAAYFSIFSTNFRPPSNQSIAVFVALCLMIFAALPGVVLVFHTRRRDREWLALLLVVAADSVPLAILLCSIVLSAIP